MSFDQSYRFGPFHVDPANARLMRGTESIPLTPKAFAVLHYLIEHQGQLVNKDEFLAAAWPETVVSAGVLKVTILELRKALGDVAKTPRFIETVHRRGYRFLPSVTTTSPVQTSTSNVQRRRSESSSSIPRPSASNTQPSILVGRDSELARMREWLDKALKGTRQIVFVTGEAGIGKTTLVEAFLAGIGKQETGNGKEEHHKESPPMPDARSPLPFVWIGRGQCIEHYGAGEAYLPVLEALSRLCRGPAGERLVPMLHQYAPMWLMQMPWLLSAVERETLTRELLGATRERMLREMADALEVVTNATPLVLVLEDLHWSDYSTLDLLTALARRSAAARLLVIGTYRPVDVIVSGHPLKALVQELLAHQQCGELPLELLNSAAIEAYLAQSFPEDTADVSSFSRLAQALHQRTSGNPLFLVNVVKEISAGDEKGKRESDWPMEAQITDVARSVPDSIRQMIERQSERLTVDHQRLLEGASVVGVEFSTAAAAAALEINAVQVEAQCEELARRGQFLAPRGMEELPDGAVTARYGFAHALYQQVLYERVGGLLRMRMHRRIGEQEEACYGGARAAELAMHFERGGDILRAVQYRQQAGENTLRQYGYREAIVHLTQGLKLLATLPETPERAQHELTLQLALGAPLTATKGYAAPEVERVYTRARELCRYLGEAPHLFPVLCGLCRFYIVRGDLPSATDVSEQLVTLAQRTLDPAFLLAAHNLAGVVLFYRGELLSAFSFLEQGHGYYDAQLHSPLRSPLFRSIQDPDVTGFVHSAWALWLLGYADRAAASMQAALTHAHGLSHPFTSAYAYHFAAGFYHCRRESQASREQEEAAFTLSTKHEFVVFLTLGSTHRGWQLIEQGQMEEGMNQLQQGLAEYRATGGALRQTMFLAMLAEGWGKIGQSTKGIAVLAEALEAVERTGESFYEAELYRLKGELLLQAARRGGPAVSPQNRKTE